jgi:predicted DNA-binding protein YlxM (UPF0122 family)
MDKLLQETLLYDFYGEMLTPHQKEIYEDFVLNDLSLSEIAQQHGISRQGVYDIIRRSRQMLSSYEEKLGLVGRFVKIRRDIGQIRENAAMILENQQNPETVRTGVGRIREISDRILDEL